MSRLASRPDPAPKRTPTGEVFHWIMVITAIVLFGCMLPPLLVALVVFMIADLGRQNSDRFKSTTSVRSPADQRTP